MTTAPARTPTTAWVFSVLLLGLVLRAYHYLRVPSMWHDEAALVVNVLHLDFAALLGPLLWHEAAPPLFLWAERAVFLALGDDLTVLRLVPFLASCAALLLMVPVARRVLPAAAVPPALFLFACSEQLLWHACEAKPYALDVLAAVLLLNVFCAAPPRSLLWKLATLTLLAPVLIGLSYPACFLYGGVLVALLPAVWRERTPAVVSAYVLLALAVGVAFGLLALGPAKAQKDGAMMSCWLHFFPDWSRPGSVLGWLVTSTLGVFRYCCKPCGEALAVLAVVGAVAWWREGRRGLLVLLGVPVFLALVAACLGRYPYGGARVMVYAAPAVVLLTAAGIVPAATWRGVRTARSAVLPLAVLLCLPGVAALRSVADPWPRADTAGAAAWVHARRAAAEPVLGNDWTHHYYFRRLGPLFHEVPAAVPADPGRVWLVYTAQAPAAERLRAARRWVAGPWRVLDRAEFEFTTVLLLSHPSE